MRRGEAKLEFRNWTIIGPESQDAAKAALAASEQGRYWSFITLFYRNQGTENTGYVTDSFLEAVAEGAGVRGSRPWDEDRQSSQWDAQIAQAEPRLGQLGFTGTPSFLVEGRTAAGRWPPPALWRFQSAIHQAESPPRGR